MFLPIYSHIYSVLCFEKAHTNAPRGPLHFSRSIHWGYMSNYDIFTNCNKREWVYHMLYIVEDIVYDLQALIDMTDTSWLV